ncbi:MAG: hypothetical protein A2V69_00445 [Candidatus Portnoybacteria bacterium RBG_13_40_8]|uniref:Uncharacterized protein n=1 Tax=Candidatus Portnoybacteria bacterium RBG_13_40_8 TaxID=1801990 RepID=A0A1G2F1L0_9BACT|nr:MAG: hypothetical protein A2V69_00445 [Candidatus Portnoybacteria bacterium RBG_13_40_8]OGZ36029.1 MAG: hypothetical protein A2V60_01785 [Candidatus Portnoybacteria bacterium RIFCSPHIGHO2_01_FULL_39_19]
MKPKFFIRLNLFLALVFLIIFVIILYSVNPFQANGFLKIIFYLVLFGLVLSILNLIGKMQSWVRILVSLTIVILLILRRQGL